MLYELSLHGGTRTDISCRQFDQGATFTLSVLEGLTGKLIRLDYNYLLSDYINTHLFAFQDVHHIETTQGT